MATIAQQLIEQGIEQGQIQGELKAKRDLLLGLLRQRFGDHVGGEVERQIANATGDQLEAWAGRILSATTLAEVLAD